jgi:hypothetical protein
MLYGTQHRGRAITNNNRGQRGGKARGEIEKKRARRPQGATTSSEKEEKKRGTAEEQNIDQDQRGGSTHRDKRDVHGRSPPRSG